MYNYAFIDKEKEQIKTTQSYDKYLLNLCSDNMPLAKLVINDSRAIICSNHFYKNIKADVDMQKVGILTFNKLKRLQNLGINEVKLIGQKSGTDIDLELGDLSVYYSTEFDIVIFEIK